MRQITLRRQICFRLCILIFAIGLGCFYAMRYLWNSIWTNITIGIFGSFLTWALVELWDVTMEAYAQYKSERDDFYIDVRNHMDEMRTALGDLPNANEANVRKVWENVYCEMEKLHTYLALLSFKYKMFILSEEYQDFEKYIWRCYWVLSACMFNKECDSEKLYKQFILEEHSEYKFDKFVAEMKQYKDISKDYRKLKDIELNTESLTVPESILSMEPSDIIHQHSSNVDGFEVVRFKPSIKFDDLMTKNEKNSWWDAFRVVVSLAFTTRIKNS